MLCLGRLNDEKVKINLLLFIRTLVLADENLTYSTYEFLVMCLYFKLQI